MLRTLLIASVVSMAAIAFAGPQAVAHERKRTAPAADTGAHPASSAYRRAPQVRGFVQRRGGYSYAASDVVNTGFNARTQFGSTNSYRNPYLDRQSRSGPFDHGFFWDSGVSPRGGSSPYLN